VDFDGNPFGPLPAHLESDCSLAFRVPALPPAARRALAAYGTSGAPEGGTALAEHELAIVLPGGRRLRLLCHHARG